MAGFRQGGAFYFPLPPGHNAFIYVVQGVVSVEQASVYTAYHAVEFNNDGEGIGLHAEEDSLVFIASGMPLHEKIAANGPFVMNTETEVLEAMRDYQMGKMGILIEE